MDNENHFTENPNSKDYFLPNFLDIDSNNVNNDLETGDLDFEGLNIDNNKYLEEQDSQTPYSNNYNYFNNNVYNNFPNNSTSTYTKPTEILNVNINGDHQNKLSKVELSHV